MGNLGYCVPRTNAPGWLPKAGQSPVEMGACEPDWSCDYFSFWERRDADIGYRSDYPGAYRSNHIRGDTTGEWNMTAIHWQCMSDGSLYVASLYWSIMSITSIGYGDIAAQPHDAHEQAVACFLMLLGAMSWAQVVGTIISVVSTINPDKLKFRTTMDSLNEYMQMYQV